MTTYDPSKPFVVIPVTDPAIDWEATETAHLSNGGLPGRAMTEYRIRYDVGMLRFLDGQQPARYHVRPLTRKERVAVRREGEPQDQYDLAFRMCLLRAENAPMMSGSRGAYARQEDEGAKGRPIPEGDMERFVDENVQEVGSAIWARSFLDPFSDHVLPLPHTSLSGLTSRYYRPSRVEQTSDSQSSESTSGERQD